MRMMLQTLPSPPALGSCHRGETESLRSWFLFFLLPSATTLGMAGTRKHLGTRSPAGGPRSRGPGAFSAWRSPHLEKGEWDMRLGAAQRRGLQSQSFLLQYQGPGHAPSMGRSHPGRQHSLSCKCCVFAQLQLPEREAGEAQPGLPSCLSHAAGGKGPPWCGSHCWHSHPRLRGTCTLPHVQGRRTGQKSPHMRALTLAAAALAAVDDRQYHGLHLPILAAQAQEADGAHRVQAVAAAVTQCLQVWLLPGGETQSIVMGEVQDRAQGCRWLSCCNACSGVEQAPGCSPHALLGARSPGRPAAASGTASGHVCMRPSAGCALARSYVMPKTRVCMCLVGTETSQGRQGPAEHIQQG